MSASDSSPRRLQDLLIDPREDLHTEIKGWPDLDLEEHKGDLAAAMLALANYGGGYVLLGHVDGPAGCIPDANRPQSLNQYSQDRINGIVRSYADPVFHCDVYHVAHPSKGDAFPIVVIPGEHRVPIRARRDGPNNRHVRQHTYYTRRPGPSSEPIQTASEWDELLDRCLRSRREDLIEDIRRLLYGLEQSAPESDPQQAVQTALVQWTQRSIARWGALRAERQSADMQARYQHGYWTVDYGIVGNVMEPRTLSDLLAKLRDVHGHETGWPPWWVPDRPGIEPYTAEGAIECWLIETQFRDPAHSDFWRASPQGMMFLLRGYEEDSHPDEIAPGTLFDVRIPIWRVGECLLHAQRFSSALSNDSASIVFRGHWRGLMGRTLTDWSARNPLARGTQHGRSRQGEALSEVTLPSRSIGPNLAEAVRALTTPLYEVFGFYTPSMEMIDGELRLMRKL